MKAETWQGLGSKPRTNQWITGVGGECPPLTSQPFSRMPCACCMRNRQCLLMEKLFLFWGQGWGLTVSRSSVRECCAGIPYRRQISFVGKFSQPGKAVGSELQSFGGRIGRSTVFREMQASELLQAKSHLDRGIKVQGFILLVPRIGSLPCQKPRHGRSW